MTDNIFAPLLAGVPRFDVQTTIGGDHAAAMYETDVLAALAAAVPADLAEAGKVLAKLQSQIGDDVQDVYLPEALHKLSADTITALIARIAAQEAQIAESRVVIQKANEHLQSVAAARDAAWSRAEAAETALVAEKAKVAKLGDAVLLSVAETLAGMSYREVSQEARARIKRALDAAIVEAQK